MLINDLLKEEDVLLGNLSPYDLFINLRDELKSSGEANFPGGASLLARIDAYAKELEIAKARGETKEIDEILFKIFEFNGEYLDLSDNSRQYKYSPGNAALLAIQKAPNSILGTADWWYKAYKMKPKPNAKYKIILKPVLDKNLDYTNVNVIKNALNKKYRWGEVKPTLKKEIQSKYPAINTEESYTGAEYYNMVQHKPIDFDVESLLVDRTERNYISQFLLQAFGLHPNEKRQGWKLGHLLSQDQVEPIGSQTHNVPSNISSTDVENAIGVAEEVTDALIEIDAYEGEIKDQTDETSRALFNDVIVKIQAVMQQNGTDAEANMNFLMGLLEVQDRVNKLRMAKTTYAYSTRNLLYLAMQADNLTEVGPATYWLAQNKRPKASGAAGKIILQPITDENPLELASSIRHKVITQAMIKNHMMMDYLKRMGANFENGMTVEGLYKVFYQLPDSIDLTNEVAWDFKLARFYLELTGLKLHKAIGYNISVVYDISDVEQIPDTEIIDNLVIPQVADIRYDGDIDKLKKLLVALSKILQEMRSNFKVDPKARDAVATNCLYPYNFDPDYVTPRMLRGKDPNAMQNFDLLRTEKNPSAIINQIARTVHLLVHEISHYNRGKLGKPTVDGPKSQADQIFYDYFGLQQGTRLYHNPVDLSYIKNEKRRLNQVGQGDRTPVSGSFVGLTTGQGEQNRYIRETQAEIITAMVMNSLGIPTQMVGNNIALLSTVTGEKALENTMGNEVHYYIDVTNAILKKIHEKLDTIQEHYQVIKTLAEQILLNKKLLNE